MARRDIGDGGRRRTRTVIVVVIQLRRYDHGGVLELDTTIVVVVSRGRIQRKGLVVVIVAMARDGTCRLGRKVTVVTMHVLGRVLWNVLCSHERRVGLLWIVLLLLLLLMEVVLELVLVLELMLSWIVGMLGLLGLLGLLGVLSVILMGVMYLVLVLVLVVLVVVVLVVLVVLLLGLGERGAVMDVVFLVGGRVRLAAIKAWMMVMLLVLLVMMMVVLVVKTERLGRGFKVRGGGGG